MSGNWSKSAFFEGVGHFEAYFTGKGASPTNDSWYQSSRVIALSCGIKISAVIYITDKYQLGDASYLRISKSICRPDFDEISQSTAEILLLPVLGKWQLLSPY